MKKDNCQPEVIKARLHRTSGQIKAIEKMYDDRRDIEDIVRLVLAARASLDSTARLLITDKVGGCYDKKVIKDKKELLKLIDILFNIT